LGDKEAIEGKKSIVERLTNLREYVLYMEKGLKLFKVVGITPRIAFYSVELSKLPLCFLPQR